MGQSIFFIGSVIGSLALGVLADRIGRLHVLVLANFFAFLGNGLTIFSKEIYTFSISRFIAGVATDSNFVMMYIIGKLLQLTVIPVDTLKYLHLYMVAFTS